MKNLYQRIKITIIQLVLLSLSCWSISAFSQTIVHHEMMVQLMPSTHQIHVIDKINLPPESQAQNNSSASYSFLVHQGEQLKVIEKNVSLKKHDYSYAKQKFPRLIGSEMRVGSVPVDVYSLNMASGVSVITLEYTRSINHAIETGGKEYERSISESSGLITEQGVFIAKESFWFPVFGDELLTFNLSVRLPPKWKSVSQGERLYSEDNESSHMDTWQEIKAQDDIYIVAAKFVEYSQAAGSVQAMAFLREADDSLAQKYLDTTAQYLEMYRNLLGPYPYTKFALVENFWETGFGMPSFTLLGPKIIRFPFILHSSYPHELLHNWWGNSVFIDYEKGNWAEGLTSYLADHLIKEQRGMSTNYRRAALQKYTNFANEENDFALQNFVGRTDAVTEAVGYGKTLMLFHMLRQEMGDEKFKEALQVFYRRYRNKTASYSDLEKTFSKVAEVDQSEFFRQWTEKPGAPNLLLKNVNVEKIANKYRLAGEVEQVQKGDGYHLALPMIVSLEGSKTANKEMLTMSAKRQGFSFEYDSRPLRLDVDPEFDVFRRLDVNETPPSLSQVFGAKKTLIVLPSEESREKKSAYESLANNWKETQQGEIEFQYDNTLNELPKDKGVWLLGWNNKFKSVLSSALNKYGLLVRENELDLAGKNLSSDQASIVLVGRNPQQLKNGIGFISSDSAKAIPGLARKLPHYGKYSYLAFEGSEPSNFVKGQWPVVGSPLSIMLTKQQTEMAKTPQRVALAKTSPVFSEKKLVKHVKYLSSEELQGRGLGTATIDKAAAYIASEFNAAGLKSINSDGSYYQDWTQKVEGKPGEIRLRNVMAYLPGKNPKYKGQSIVVSAHYDHLGLGWPDVRKGNQGKVHFGADDNASGVSIMIELAHLLAKKGVERSVIFVAFTGEEASRLGSRYFVNHVPQFSVDKVFAAVNLDTVGRLGDNPILVFGTGTASEWVHIFRGVGFVTGVKMKSLAKDFGSSDQTSFHEKNIPAVQFFSGVNADFHKPTDTIEKIDSAGMVKVAVALKETVAYLAERELPLTNLLNKDKNKTAKAKSQAGGRRVSLGTVPDFTYQGDGVLVSDVVANSPAESDGVLKNDVIVAMNGNKVADLRDFSNILRSLKPGDEITLNVQRQGETVSIKTHVVER